MKKNSLLFSKRRGYIEANAIIFEQKNRVPGRPALIDELSKL